jgi:hypothetical protein
LARFRGRRITGNEVMSCEFTQDPDSKIAGLTLLAEGKHRCIKDTGVYIPPTVTLTGAKLNVILWLHGYYVHSPKDLFAPSVKSRATSLRESLLDSKKNAILVAPWLGYRDQEGGSLGLGDLGAAGGTQKYLDEVLAALSRYVAKNPQVTSGVIAPAPAPPADKKAEGSSRRLVEVVVPKFEIGNLIVAGHSAGGGMLKTVVDSGLGTLKDKLKECWGFDCFYGEWSTWVRGGSLSKVELYFYVADGSGGGGQWLVNLWKAALGTLKAPLPAGPLRNLHLALGLKSPGTLVDRTAFQTVDDIKKKVAPNDYEKVRAKLDPLLDGKLSTYWIATKKELINHFQIVRDAFGHRAKQSSSL